MDKTNNITRLQTHLPAINQSQSMPHDSFNIKHSLFQFIQVGMYI